MRRSLYVGLVASLVAFGVVAPAEAAPKRIPAYKNCQALNKVYKHGVGKKGAKDKVAKGKRPVTTFLVHDQGYRANYKKLDRDHDGIACEKL